MKRAEPPAAVVGSDVDPISAGPAWVKCDSCDDFLCRVHVGQHAWECDCPALEEWIDERGVDPYLAGGPPLGPGEVYDDTSLDAGYDDDDLDA